MLSLGFIKHSLCTTCVVLPVTGSRLYFGLLLKGLNIWVPESIFMTSETIDDHMGWPVFFRSGHHPLLRMTIEERRNQVESKSYCLLLKLASADAF